MPCYRDGAVLGQGRLAATPCFILICETTKIPLVYIIIFPLLFIIYNLILSLNFGDDRRSGEPTPPKCNYDTGDWPDCPLSLSSAATAPLSDICPAAGIPFPVIDCVKSLAYTFLSFMSQLL